MESSVPGGGCALCCCATGGRCSGCSAGSSEGGVATLSTTRWYAASPTSPLLPPGTLPDGTSRPSFWGGGWEGGGGCLTLLCCLVFWSEERSASSLLSFPSRSAALSALSTGNGSRVAWGSCTQDVKLRDRRGKVGREANSARGAERRGRSVVCRAKPPLPSGPLKHNPCPTASLPRPLLLTLRSLLAPFKTPCLNLRPYANNSIPPFLSATPFLYPSPTQGPPAA